MPKYDYQVDIHHPGEFTDEVLSVTVEIPKDYADDFSSWFVGALRLHVLNTLEPTDKREFSRYRPRDIVVTSKDEIDELAHEAGEPG